MTDGFGAITWWGFSPALDFQEILKGSSGGKTCENDPVHILLVGAGDLRHVLLTVARKYRHTPRKLCFHILEGSLELYARDMLFLTIALEPQTRMGLQEKTELFLELFGNILIRKQSTEYVEKMSTELIKMVTDFSYLEKKLPVVDLSQLKFKERDFLDAIFKFWRNPAITGVFEVSKYWDLRIRKLLGTRYDSRINVYDWDYQMRLVQREADIIHSHEYKYWRENGQAFEVREADYEIPNKTMASGLILTHEGEKHARRGYWGDILVSPYVTLGIQCEETEFFKKSNKQYMKTACNVAEYNVMSMLHEIANRTKYVQPKPAEKEETGEKDGPKITEITEEEVSEDDKTDSKTDAEKLSEQVEREVAEELKKADLSDIRPLDQEYEPLPLNNVSISFLPMNSLPDLGRKAKYRGRFDLVYFSNSMVHLLTPDVAPAFADTATVVIESARYMLELKLEQVKMFVEKVIGLGKEAGCKSPDKCNPETANYVQMQFVRDSKKD
ncbi:dynein axonemal assembly factor 3-like [Mya arenaria]|uniref:dynein axonemal assembly factor 3-like n=1 Tax=Mya arenaria TaxID=6604 RepID=UPI0022E660A0|nr:dynein axonemal assembly factor 3-like [Mya arenaria]